MTATVSDSDRAQAKKLYHELTSRGLLMEKRIYPSGKDEAIEVLAEALADERERAVNAVRSRCRRHRGESRYRTCTCGQFARAVASSGRARDTGDNR